MDDFDRLGGDACPQVLLQQLMRHGVKTQVALKQQDCAFDFGFTSQQRFPPMGAYPGTQGQMKSVRWASTRDMHSDT